MNNGNNKTVSVVVDEEGESRMTTADWLLKQAAEIESHADGLQDWIENMRASAVSTERDIAQSRIRAAELRAAAASIKQTT